MIENASVHYGKFLEALGFDWRADPHSDRTPFRVAKAWVNDLIEGSVPRVIYPRQGDYGPCSWSIKAQPNRRMVFTPSQHPRVANEANSRQDRRIVCRQSWSCGCSRKPTQLCQMSRSTTRQCDEDVTDVWLLLGFEPSIHSTGVFPIDRSKSAQLIRGHYYAYQDDK